MNNPFASLGLSKTLQENLASLEYTLPTPIQEAVIPEILKGKDLIGQAQTGTGKTAAFLLPSLDKIQGSKHIGLLIITPTRELAHQVDKELHTFSKGMAIKSLPIFGGSPISKQIKRLKEGVQAIVATPGRLLDLLKSGKIPHFNPSTVILDEADEMLDMGFVDDIKKIFEYLPEDRQTLLFSATLSQAIKNLAGQILNKPLHINTSKQDTSKANITQEYYLVEERQRERALLRLIDFYQPEKAIIFCRTKMEVDELFTRLYKRNFPVEALHGDMEQAKRQKAIQAFREGNSQYLVATDVAGRGLNILDISHVFNYHMPLSAESYTHRIGRTGRAGQKGVAITLLSPHEARRRAMIIEKNKKSISFCKLPSLKEVQHNKINCFKEKLLNNPPHPQAHELYKKLKDKRTAEELLLSLLSLPELFLFPEEEHDELLSPVIREKKGKNAPSTNRKRRRALSGKIRKKKGNRRFEGSKTS